MGDGDFHPNGFLLCKLDLGSGRHILLVNLQPDCEDEDTRMEEFRVWEEKIQFSEESPQVNNLTTMPAVVSKALSMSGNVRRFFR